MKTFTLDEAQSLLPVLKSLLKQAIEAKQAAEKIETQQQNLRQRIFLMGGMMVDIAASAHARAAMESFVRKAKDAVQEIDSIGVQVKDLETGLLDFPCLVDGETVLLCWRMGEEKIDFWHTIESGFQGRQPLDDRFRKSRPERPN